MPLFLIQDSQSLQLTGLCELLRLISSRAQLPLTTSSQRMRLSILKAGCMALQMEENASGTKEQTEGSEGMWRK